MIEGGTAWGEASTGCGDESGVAGVQAEGSGDEAL